MILPSIGVSCQAVSTNQRIMRYESLLPETQIGFLGPKGTFAEQALLSEADLAGARSDRMTQYPMCSTLL